MREILFRGKQPVTNEWVYGALITEKSPFDKNLVMTHIYDENCNEILVDPRSVGQYIDLKDKNGNMIFEGDFVIEVKGLSDVPGLIVFDDFRFQMKWRNIDKFIIDCPRYYEIVGNKYDNPDLNKVWEDSTL